MHRLRMGECFAYYLKFYIRTELSFSFIKELVNELIQMYEQNHSKP